MDGTRKRGEDPSIESFTVQDRPDAPFSLATAPLFAPGSVLAERYELRQVLGRGGMGVVFEAYDRILDESVAIKIVRAEYAGERAWAERLAREVKLARQINHPNVCRVFDFGQADAHPFLIMELAGRGTLRDEIIRGEVQKRPLDGRLSDARTLASGLAAIHAAGIVHRDIAPQNALRMDDGRLVLSDFGLAVDNVDGGSSIHGGTVAYMAPEVVRGSHSSFASDVWSLGVVIHEAVFGVRPRWSADGIMAEPASLGLPTAAERKVFLLCRACTDVSPERRPRSPTVVEEALGGGRLPRRRPRRASLVTAAAVVTAAIFAVMLVIRARPSRFDESSLPHVLSPRGTTADWSARANVLATVSGKIQCMELLPDRKTLRFVWGIPRRAEDLDTQTGRRSPSDLVPAAYAEGCPSVAPDGSKLVFAGHDRDQRPAAFVSTRLDGANAVPVVATGEPSLSTDPVWFPDADSFLYAVDLSHSAMYSMKDRSSVVIPSDTHLAQSTDYSVVGSAVAVLKQVGDGSSDVSLLRLPHLDERLHIKVPTFLSEAATPDDRHYYMVVNRETSPRFVVLDAARLTLANLGTIPGKGIRYPVFTPQGLAFAAIANRFTIRETSTTGAAREWEAPDGLTTVSACGDRWIGTQIGEYVGLVWLDRSGKLLGRVAFGRAGRIPRCSVDGRTVYFVELSPHPVLVRCEDGQCREIYGAFVNGFDLSPDGQRIVFLAVGDDGLSVRWVRADGQGAVHDIASTQVACTPEWSSSTSIWFSTRRGADLVWREVSADTGRSTGRTAPGRWDCMDGMDDPASPTAESVKVVWQRESQIRFVRSGQLGVE